MKRGKQIGIWLLVLAVLCSSGCGMDKLKAGECVCNIALDYIPQEFMMLEENVGSLMELNVTLKNVENQKNYKVSLNRENSYRAAVYVPEGEYKVVNCGAYPDRLVDLQLGISEKRIKLTAGKERTLSVSIKNEEEFTDWVWNMQMKRKIGQLDKFSRKVQCNGKIFKLQDIAKNIDFSTDRKVKSGKTATLYNRENQITLTVKNTEDQTMVWSDCEIEKVKFERNNVIFGQGARIGMSVYDIANEEKGIYGVPDALSGSLLFGQGHGSTNIIYKSEDSTDQMTLTSSSDGEYIACITYELETR